MVGMSKRILGVPDCLKFGEKIMNIRYARKNELEERNRNVATY